MNMSLKDRYGLFFDQGMKLRSDAGESISCHLKPGNVPQELWPLLPYAEFWGIADDGFREELVEKAPETIFKEFREVISSHREKLFDWLAGPEAGRNEPSDEYIAYSAMLMAYDYPRLP